jgi:serine/threonine protein kinase
MLNEPQVEQFGRYRLLRKIGQGGMSEVFLAQADGAAPAAAPLVIKRLHTELEKNRDVVDLFLTEADVTVMLNHPNIIRVYDSGEINNRYYIAMEYVHGKDLEQIFDRLCAKGLRLDPVYAIHIVAEILRGLDYVHQAKAPSGRSLGIVHRDVTPSNVYISVDGEVKLGDFGVAKLVGFEGWTMAGSVKGKLGYLSPEQVSGQPPTIAIDLWAAALILYELVAGTRVFVGENELDVMLRIRTGKVPSLRKVNREAPKALESILERALHRKVRKRYETARAFLTALEQLLAATGRDVTRQGLAQYLTSQLS